jgi:carbon monoxide dehydrogenase subunit G
MPHAEHTITVARPPHAVFDYLADGTHNREWRAGVLEIERTSEADGEGATYRQVLAGPAGRRIDGDYRITVFDRPRRLEFQVTAGPARPSGVFELSEAGDQSSRVRFALDLDATGPMKLMTPMVTRTMRREVAQLDNIKAILEQTT